MEMATPIHWRMTAKKSPGARLVPEDPNAIQIAVSRALLQNAEEFLWGAWDDGGVKIQPVRLRRPLRSQCSWIAAVKGEVLPGHGVSNAG